MKIKVAKEFDYYTRCEFCGEDITETSIEFGMDCKNHCSEKEFIKMLEEGKVSNEVLELVDWIKTIRRGEQEK